MDPLAFVSLAVRPVVRAVAVLLVVLILALVFAAIRPCVDALSMQLIFFPLSYIAPAVRPSVLTFSFDVIINPVASIHRVIGPFVSTLSPFLSILEHAVVFGAILKLFLSRPVLHIIAPESFIGLAVRMDVDAKAIRPILIELSCVNVSVGVMEVALPFSHSIAPVSFVLRTIKPYLGPLAVLDEHLLICFAVYYFLHLPCVGGTFSDLEVRFPDHFFLIYFFDLVAECGVMCSAILILRNALAIAVLFFIVDFVIARLTFCWLPAALIAHC